MTPVQAELKKVRELHCRALALLLAKVPYVALEVFEELRRSHVLLEEPWNPEQVDAVVAVQACLLEPGSNKPQALIVMFRQNLCHRPTPC